MDCVIYIRWSSAEQSKGSSLERQRADCRAHAARHGWRVVRELIDDGVSAFKGRHATVGLLGGFVDEVENGEHPAGIILLVEKLDRLSREKAKKVFAWMLGLTDMGVTIATVDGDRRYTSENLDMAAIIEVVVKAQLAHEESDKKSTRLAAAWAAKRAKVLDGQQIVMTKRAPAWLAVEGTPPRFVLIEERAAIVRRIFEETVAGLGKHTIARRLNMEGVPTFGRASGWHSSYIQKILTSATVLGSMQPGSKARGEARVLIGDPIEGYYPSVIDADLHARAMVSMAQRSRRVAGRGRRLVNLFGGLAKCGECGERMTFRGKGAKLRADGSVVQEDYLICDSYQRGPGCAKVSGPLLDRIDLHVDVAAVTAAELVLPPPAEGSAQVAVRVAAARAIQAARYRDHAARTNAEAEGPLLDAVATPDEAGRQLLAQAAVAMKLTARGYTRILRVARTIADLAGQDMIGRIHLAEALGYRRQPPRN